MRQALVIGNWKMHGSTADVQALLQPLIAGAQGLAADIAVCPPYVYLNQAAGLLTDSNIGLGAQNCAGEASGAFTGEVAAAMLADSGCGYVLLGHSERRSLYAETDTLVVTKVGQVLANNMRPVICVGETLEQRDAGETMAIVNQQLQAVLDAYSEQELADCIVAYEPVWAIGTGRTASPEQAQEVHAGLRSTLAAKSEPLAEKTRILYGGSVNAKNADELFGEKDIDGGLIGGASLKADDFLQICKAAAA